MPNKKHNYRVFFSVLKRSEGDIIREAVHMDVVAANSAWAQVACVQALRSEYPNDTHRIIIHECIWYDTTSESNTVDELLTDDN